MVATVTLAPTVYQVFAIPACVNQIAMWMVNQTSSTTTAASAHPTPNVTPIDAF